MKPIGAYIFLVGFYFVYITGRQENGTGKAVLALLTVGIFSIGILATVLAAMNFIS